MAKFIKLTSNPDGKNVWVNMDKVELICERNGGSVIQYPDGSVVVAVTEIPEKIMSIIQATENGLNHEKGYPSYPEFALAADLKALLEEFREFKRLLSSELEMYNRRLNNLEHPQPATTEATNPVKPSYEELIALMDHLTIELHKTLNRVPSARYTPRMC